MIESMILFCSTLMAMGLFSCVDLHFSINEDSIEFEEEDEEPEM
ncbi:MAG TPA: hypothetical protein VIK89_09520 [Cytophagaceae bacterium]